MARGWESKSVEAQQEDASRHRPTRPAPTPAQLERAERRRTLELARHRAAADLTRASAPAHRQMLERGIASLDEQIRAFDESA